MLLDRLSLCTESHQIGCRLELLHRGTIKAGKQDTVEPNYRCLHGIYSHDQESSLWCDSSAKDFHHRFFQVNTSSHSVRTALERKDHWQPAGHLRFESRSASDSSFGRWPERLQHRDSGAEVNNLNVLPTAIQWVSEADTSDPQHASDLWHLEALEWNPALQRDLVGDSQELLYLPLATGCGFANPREHPLEVWP